MKRMHGLQRDVSFWEGLWEWFVCIVFVCGLIFAAWCVYVLVWVALGE
jgi:hypothetical protein